MKLLQLIRKESLQIFRNRTAIIMMIIFPIAMVIILGFALSSNFSSSENVPKITVNYVLEGNKETIYQKKFVEFLDSLHKELHLDAKKSDNLEADKQLVSNGALTAALEVKQNNSIVVTTNTINQQNADLINMLVTNYVDTAKTYTSIAQLYPQDMARIKDRVVDYVRLSTIQISRNVTSFDYYSISMFTMIAFYSIISSMNLVISDRTNRVGNRIALTGVSRSLILMAKLIGGMISTGVQLAILYCVTRFILHVNWGDQWLSIIGITASLVYLAVAIGIGLAYIIRNEAFLNGIANTFIPIMAFLGGCYVPLSVINVNFITQLSVISPITWVNKSLFYIVYGGNYNPVMFTVAINIAIGTGFILLSMFRMRKQVAA